MGAPAIKAEGRRNGWLPWALGASLALHAALAWWVYMVRSPDALPEPMQRIIPVFIVPKKAEVPPPPPPPPPKARPTGPQHTDPGGQSGQGMERRAIPLNQPRADPPPNALPPPVNPAPNATSLNPSTGQGDVPGPGTAATPGPGSGVGQGTGPGVGSGRDRGGPAAAPPDWRPQWRRLPTRDQLDKHYPQSARARGVEGGALLECTLGVTGSVTDCVVVREVPAGEGFGKAAIQLSRYFRITPRRVNGRAVETRMRIPYTMTLDAPNDEASATGSNLRGAPQPRGPVQAPARTPPPK